LVTEIVFRLTDYWKPINNSKTISLLPHPAFYRFFNPKKLPKIALNWTNPNTIDGSNNTTEVSLLEAQQQQQLQPPLISGLQAPSCHPSPAELLI
jgi:hypothetical protein